MRVFLFMLCMLALTACGAHRPQVQSTVLVREAARHPEGRVEFIAGVPDRPHVVLGMVLVQQPPGWNGAQPAECMTALTEEVLRMGGDAVIRFESHSAPGGTVGAGSFTAQGTVVKWVTK